VHEWDGREAPARRPLAHLRDLAPAAGSAEVAKEDRPGGLFAGLLSEAAPLQAPALNRTRQQVGRQRSSRSYSCSLSRVPGNLPDPEPERVLLARQGEVYDGRLDEAPPPRAVEALRQYIENIDVEAASFVLDEAIGRLILFGVVVERVESTAHSP
jgi:hypothetical protein